MPFLRKDGDGVAVEIGVAFPGREVAFSLHDLGIRRGARRGRRFIPLVRKCELARVRRFGERHNRRFLG